MLDRFNRGIDIVVAHTPGNDLVVQYFAVGFMIIDDQDPQADQGFGRLRLSDILAGGGERNIQSEKRAIPRGAFQFYLARHQINQSTGNRQAQSGSAKPTAGATVDLVECIENGVLFLEWDTGSRVGNFEHHLIGVDVTLLHACRQPDLAALGKLDRVTQQVNHHLA